METRDRLVRACGWIWLIGSLIGAASAVAIIVWPAQVAPTQYSYPFNAASFTAVQAFFSVRHLAETAGVVGLIALVWRAAGPLLRIGLVLSLLGTLLFVGMEAVAISAAHAAADSTIATAVNSAYSAPTLVFGVGLVLSGIGLGRMRALPGAVSRWLVLVCGIYVFVPLLPALFATEVVGRVAIGVWLLLMAGAARGILRAVRQPSSRLLSAVSA